MKIKYGIDGRLYAVFSDSYFAAKWDWLFVRILRRRLSCFGGYENSYQIT